MAVKAVSGRLCRETPANPTVARCRAEVCAWRNRLEFPVALRGPFPLRADSSRKPSALLRYGVECTAAPKPIHLGVRTIRRREAEECSGQAERAVTIAPSGRASRQ